MKIIEFIVASSVLTLMPGPDILFVLAQSLVQGRRAGVAIALGLCSGLLVHTAAAALGLSLIIASSPTLFAAIKYAGVLYLAYMGIMSVVRIDTAGSANAPAQQIPLGKLYRTGITMNLLNPKIILFFLAFLPQFVDTSSEGSAVQIAVLGVTFALVAVTVFTLVALVANAISRRFHIDRLSAKLMAWIKAAVYWGIGLMFLFG